MKFFNKELCKQLDGLGCVCKTLFAYYHNWPSPIYDIALYPKPHEQIFVCNAFSIYDFLSDEEYAEKNCKKLFGNYDDYECPFCGTTDVMIDTFKYAKCDLSISKNQEAYIEEAVEKLNERK